MKDTICIGKRHVGQGQPCFIIAEAGVNHNGDPELAKQLIREAKKAGADAVKFQTFKAERVVTGDAPKAKYQLKTTDAQESQIDMLKKLELPLDAYKELIDLCAEEGILFLSTPYNPEDVDLLDDIGAPAFKLASISIVEPSFLAYTATKKKPIIASTGMATMEEVQMGVQALHDAGCEDLVILQCTTNYPSRAEDANLLAMQTMRDELGVLVGYSDHTQTNTVCIASVALGACVIEKHFTLDTSLPGPDQSSSYDPAAFAQLVQDIREAEATLGSGRKEPCEAESNNAPGMRRSIVAKRNLSVDEVIDASMITLKRPATGLAPTEWSHLIGRTLIRDLAENDQISFDDVEKV